jgi:hypothetical protein
VGVVRGSELGSVAGTASGGRARPVPTLASLRMDEGAIERAKERLKAAAEGRIEPAAVEAALERARTQVEALAELAARIEEALPQQVGDAVRDGVRAEALPVARNVAEIRGLLNAVVRRLERIEGDTLAERHARVDDLALLVELITSGWKSVDERIARLEKAIGDRSDAIVYRIEERRPPAEAG